MGKLDTKKISSYSLVSSVWRIDTSFFSIFLAIVFTAFMIFAQTPPLVLIIIIFLITLTLGLLVSFWRSHYVSNRDAVVFLIVLIWALVCFLVSPWVIKQYYFAAANNIIPTYSDAPLEVIEFTPADMSSAPSVDYWYESAEQEADYQKMHDIYKNTFTNNGYVVDEEVVGSYIRFQKQNATSPRVFLGISKQKPDQVNVHIAF